MGIWYLKYSTNFFYFINIREFWASLKNACFLLNENPNEKGFIPPEHEIYSSYESFNITVKNSLNPTYYGLLSTGQRYILLQIKGYDEKGKLLSNLREKKMNFITTLCKIKNEHFCLNENIGHEPKKG